MKAPSSDQFWCAPLLSTTYLLSHAHSSVPDFAILHDFVRSFDRFLQHLTTTGSLRLVSRHSHQLNNPGWVVESFSFFAINGKGPYFFWWAIKDWPLYNWTLRCRERSSRAHFLGNAERQQDVAWLRCLETSKLATIFWLRRVAIISALSFGDNYVVGAAF